MTLVTDGAGVGKEPFSFVTVISSSYEKMMMLNELCNDLFRLMYNKIN